MEKLIVNEKYNKKKLKLFVLESLPYLSSNTFYKILRKKDIKVNDKRVNTNIDIFTNDQIIVYVPDSLKNKADKIEILYEDDNIVVVYKEANLEVVGENSLTTVVQKKYKESQFKPEPCHRLDRNTTGLVLYAKNEESLRILEKKFKNHEIEKYYKALVYGIPKNKSAKLEAYLFKDRKKSMVYISDEYKKGYKRIITYYKILKVYENNSSLLEVRIETGRTHQIRAHLAHIGYPIIGDGKYGINKVNKQFGLKQQQLCHYMLIFNFKSNSGILDYLNGKIFNIKTK